MVVASGAASVISGVWGMICLNLKWALQTGITKMLVLFR